MQTPLDKENLLREPFIAALLTAWEHETASLGTDTHLAVQELLRQLPKQIPTEELKTLIAPVLTRNAQQQQRFYLIFDTVLEQLRQQMAAHEKEVEKDQRTYFRQKMGNAFRILFLVLLYRWRRWSEPVRALILILAGLGCISAGVYLWKFLFHERAITKVHAEQLFMLPANLGDAPRTYCFEAINPELGEITSVQNITGDPRHVAMAVTHDQVEICIQYQGISEGRDRLNFKICFSSGSCVHIIVVFRVEHYVTDPEPFSSTGALQMRKSKPVAGIDRDTMPHQMALQKLDTANALLDTARFTQQSGQYVSAVSSGWRFGAGDAYFTPLKWLILLLSIASLLLLGIWLRRKREKFSLKNLHNQDEMDWHLRVPLLGAIAPGEYFYRALTEMRRRGAVESRQLHMPETIKATIQKGGMIDFRFKAKAQTKDYLFLVDKICADNLRTKLFEWIVCALRENEAPVEIFYYENDLSRCWNERYPQGVDIQDIQHKYRDSYLVVWSDGDTLLRSGALLETRLNVWKKRVLLTPVSAQEWGAREAALAAYFRVLPGTPRGLAALTETLEAVEPENYLLWQRVRDIPMAQCTLPEDMPADELIEALAMLLETNATDDDRLLRWVAACALPPVLIWDWLQHTGEMLAHPMEQFLTLDHLFKITRLPWFSQGRIPEKHRGALLNWLEDNHPGWAIRFRHEWGKIMNLDANMPPIGSLAWQSHRIQVILNELLQKPDWLKRRKLEAELDQLLFRHASTDALLIHYMEQRDNPLDHLLSDRFRKYVQEKRGVNWYWRDWTWQAAGSLAVLSALLLLHYTEPVRVFVFENVISNVAASPDNHTLAATGNNGSVALCQTDGQWLSGKRDIREKIVETAFSTDGSTILTGSADGVLKFWDISGAPLYAYKTDNRLITSMKFFDQESKVLIGYYSGEVKIWDVRNKKVLQTIKAHPDAVLDVDIAPDSRALLTCSRDGTAKLWSPGGALIQTLSGHKDQVLTVCFSPDGSKIATGSRDETAILWDDQGNLLRVLRGHEDNLLDVRFTGDGQHLITASADKTARLWSVADGKAVRVFSGHSDKVNALSVSRDGTMLLTGSNDQTVRLWKL